MRGGTLKTTKRFEYKYLISYVDYYKVIEAVKTMLIHDKHGEEDNYPVNSIYIDDIQFTGAADKAFGNQFHKKYRIRFYHSLESKKLELKEKTGDESVKYACDINDEVYEGILTQDLDVLEKNFEDPLIRRYTLDMLRHNLEPKCNIKYFREAYRDETDNLRITFDHSVSVERFSNDFSNEYLKLMKDSTLILEIKYEHFLPKYIKSILKGITLNQIAYSKYFMGFNAIEL